MSNNQIVLPDFVIANLYGNNLVVGNDVVVKEKTAVSANIATTAPTPDSTSVSIPPSTPVSTPIVTPIATAIPKVDAPVVNQVSNPAESPTKPEANNKAIELPKQWFLGNNGKQITVMVKEETVPYINDKHLQFLSNVLSACKLNLGDIALVNYKNYPLGFDELKTKSNPKIVLAFDLSPKELKLPFTIPVYQVQDYAQCRFLFAPSLIKMEADSADAKAEKTKLWNSLKTLFGL